MEAVEEPPAGQCNKDLSTNIAKGKRTKRHRTHSPIPFTIRTPTISSSAVPAASSSSEDSTTTEEEDTARCLILLARGHFPTTKTYDQRIPETAAKTNTMYTCKTCNRAFTSFQALGGHRASHKKPKNEKKSTIFSDEEDLLIPSPSSLRNRAPSNSLSLQLSDIPPTACSASLKSPSPRIHECSYCGAEFTSGQALGGHMRRHRAGPVSPSPKPTPTAAVELKSRKNVLSLDLNLPAPEDEAASRHVLSTTATPKLVHCHY